MPNTGNSAFVRRTERMVVAGCKNKLTDVDFFFFTNWNNDINKLKMQSSLHKEFYYFIPFQNGKINWKAKDCFNLSKLVAEVRYKLGKVRLRTQLEEND